MIIRCPNFAASQKVKNATKNITGRLCADLDGQESWFTTFKDTTETVLNKKNLTKAAKSDEKSEALLNLKDINFTYDSTSNFITKVTELFLQIRNISKPFLVADVANIHH